MVLSGNLCYNARENRTLANGRPHEAQDHEVVEVDQALRAEVDLRPEDRQDLLEGGGQARHRRGDHGARGHRLRRGHRVGPRGGRAHDRRGEGRRGGRHREAQALQADRARRRAQGQRRLSLPREGPLRARAAQRMRPGRRGRGLRLRPRRDRRAPGARQDARALVEDRDLQMVPAPGGAPVLLRPPRLPGAVGPGGGVRRGPGGAL